MILYGLIEVAQPAFMFDELKSNHIGIRQTNLKEYSNHIGIICVCESVKESGSSIVE